MKLIKTPKEFSKLKPGNVVIFISNKPPLINRSSPEYWRTWQSHIREFHLLEHILNIPVYNQKTNITEYFSVTWNNRPSSNPREVYTDLYNSLGFESLLEVGTTLAFNNMIEFLTVFPQDLVFLHSETISTIIRETERFGQLKDKKANL